jgi:hypothetical protein
VKEYGNQKEFAVKRRVNEVALQSIPELERSER